MSDGSDRNIRSTMRLRSFKSRTSHYSCYSLTSLCPSHSYSSSPLSSPHDDSFVSSRQLVRVTRGDSDELSGGLFSTFGNLYYYKYGIDGIDSGMSALTFWYIFIHFLQIKGVKICL